MPALKRVIPAVALGLAVAGCQGELMEPQYSITALVTSVTVDGLPADVSLDRGTPPDESTAPVIDATLPAAAINGGSFEVTVSSADAFSEIVLGMSGMPDYYRVSLGSPQTAATLVVTLDPGAPAGGLEFLLAGGVDPATFGPYVSRALSVTRVGSGDVQVSVAWNTAADVDLHVVDPTGEEIYWSHRESASGGELDLDSNAACNSDQPRNENIVWPTSQAPRGEYIVRVDYWNNCGAAATDYVVTFHVEGQQPQVFSGTFTGGGDGGGEGSGIEIGRFTY